MLDQVAALGALRRGGLRPGPAIALLDVADADPRPVCPPAATARLAELLDAWPTRRRGSGPSSLTVATGARSRPSRCSTGSAPIRPGVPSPCRRSVRSGTGSPSCSPTWSVPANLGRAGRTAAGIPADVQRLARADADALAGALAEGLESGEFSKRHQPMFERVLCSVPIDHLPVIAAPAQPSGHQRATMGIALSLADLAATRHAMIQELHP
ncbi:MAG: hypothetical protein R2715_17730 [Ilumatobacteraceae bacterium]